MPVALGQPKVKVKRTEVRRCTNLDLERQPGGEWDKEKVLTRIGVYFSNNATK